MRCFSTHTSKRNEFLRFSAGAQRSASPFSVSLHITGTFGATPARQMSFQGDSRAALIGTATAFALGLSLMTAYTVKSALTAWPRGSFLQFTVLGIFFSNCCCILAYGVMLFIVGTEHKSGCDAAALVGIWGYLVSKFVTIYSSPNACI